MRAPVGVETLTRDSTGGLRPSAGTCNESTVGTTAEVPYTADYHFWKATGH